MIAELVILLKQNRGVGTDRFPKGNRYNIKKNSTLSCFLHKIVANKHTLFSSIILGCHFNIKIAKIFNNVKLVITLLSEPQITLIKRITQLLLPCLMVNCALIPTIAKLIQIFKLNINKLLIRAA